MTSTTALFSRMIRRRDGGFNRSDDIVMNRMLLLSLFRLIDSHSDVGDS